MKKNPDRSPAAAPGDATVPDTPRAPALDINGFDPTEFEWRPVPRRPRKDGWTPEAQQRFIETLACTGSVDQACQEVGLSVRSAYKLRNAPGGERFDAAWRAVMARAADRVLDIAMEQATRGEEVPVFDTDGVRTGVTWKYNTRMAIFLLRAYHPDRFRFAHKDARTAAEPQPPVDVPTPAAVAALAPVTPAAPQLLMRPNAPMSLILDARDEAARLRADPPDEREPWRAERVPEQPAHVHQQARRRRFRRDQLDARTDDRMGVERDRE
ncbi:MAG: hypothetical protein JWN21_1265 [Sphingomonas bacterium]|uniref:hypothetical protein n=1 Tax=Sphingomonas bacterium TaxID=1895847 RepID=UPI00261187D2|nr:hypothetical protein [Sphingomonas bacterium]MDB5695722.1 hypothetical protein [Sphingomonas bacterium]